MSKAEELASEAYPFRWPGGQPTWADQRRMEGFVDGFHCALSGLKEEIDKLRAESCPGHMDFWDVLDHFTEFIKQNESK